MSPLALSLRLLQAQPDERLLALARRGHEPAFEALVRRYRRQLLAYCRNLAASRASAEDILQQALMQAWTALASGVEVQDARAWLYRIVHNAAISATRKVGEDPAQLSHEVASVETEQVVEQRFAAREALAGVAALPALQREVLLGTAVEGRSHEEVAASLGLTSGSVRGLLYRARSTLRAAAAALIPTPMVEWAIRQDPAGRGGPTGLVEVVAGGGSAGVAGAVLKGGAAFTVAGALAGTAAVVVTHRLHLQPAPARAAVVQATTSKRLIVAAISEPSVGAAARAGAAADTARSATRTSLEPVRLRLADRHGGSTSATQTIDARQPAARGVSDAHRSGSHRADGGHSGSDQIRPNGGAGSSPSNHQGTGWATTAGGGDHSHHGSEWTGTGAQASAATATGADGSSAWRDRSSNHGDWNGTRGSGGASQGDDGDPGAPQPDTSGAQGGGTQGGGGGTQGGGTQRAGTQAAGSGTQGGGTQGGGTQGGGPTTQGGASATQGNTSGTQANPTSASQTGSGAGATSSQGTSTTTTQSSQAAPRPSTGTP